jgi:mRNA interferase MazF
MNKRIERGDIWLANLNPTVGSEINKTRPVVVISRTDYNLLAETFTVIPVSTGRYLDSFHVHISSLKQGSHAVIPQVRAASKKRLIKKVGCITDAEIEDIALKLRFYLDLIPDQENIYE